MTSVLTSAISQPEKSKHNVQNAAKRVKTNATNVCPLIWTRVYLIVTIAVGPEQQSLKRKKNLFGRKQ